MFDFKFNWSTEFETHIEEIDTQHKQLFKIGRDIEQLLQIKCIGVTDKQLLSIVGGLRDFVAYHFYEEESLMEEYQYPNRIKHRKEHLAFSEKITKIDLPKLKDNPEKELSAIRWEIQDSVFKHIMLEDKAFTEFVIKKRSEEVKQKEVKDEDEAIFGIKICELDVTRVYLYPEQSHRGRVVLVYKDKVKSLDKLVPLERNTFFSDMDRVAKALKKLYAPQALNYGNYGDIDKKVAFHIVPKYENEFEWNEPFAINPEKVFLTQEEYELMAKEIKKAIK